MSVILPANNLRIALYESVALKNKGCGILAEVA
jgi:hypothetical protein